MFVVNMFFFFAQLVVNMLVSSQVPNPITMKYKQTNKNCYHLSVLVRERDSSASVAIWLITMKILK